jgi:hypothetical protein
MRPLQPLQPPPPPPQQQQHTHHHPLPSHYFHNVPQLNAHVLAESAAVAAAVVQRWIGPVKRMVG